MTLRELLGTQLRGARTVRLSGALRPHDLLLDTGASLYFVDHRRSATVTEELIMILSRGDVLRKPRLRARI
jgi:hypothetical protein